MINLKNQKFNLINLVEILFYTFPLSFIVGNFMLSLHLMIFIILSLFLIKNERLSFKANLSHWIIATFFLYLFLSTTIQFQIPGFLNEKTRDWPIESHPIFKSLILIRYLILFSNSDRSFADLIFKAFCKNNFDAAVVEVSSRYLS